MCRTRKTARRTGRRLSFRTGRTPHRASVRFLPGHRRQPSDLAQALTACTRAIRCHRHLARLAPGFFDSAVVDREAREWEERRRQLAPRELALARVYGRPVVPEPGADWNPKLRFLPGPRTQRAVERELAERKFWLAAAHQAMDRHEQRRPHALLSLGQTARLLEIALEFGRLACGLDSRQPVPPAPRDDSEVEQALARSYGSPESLNGTPRPVATPD